MVAPSSSIGVGLNGVTGGSLVGEKAGVNGNQAAEKAHLLVRLCENSVHGSSNLTTNDVKYYKSSYHHSP
jgi:hypothetical protein